MTIRALAIACIGLLSAILCADEQRYVPEDGWVITIAPTAGQKWLGSEDLRRGTYYALQYSVQEPRFTFRGSDAQMVLEAYYQFTKGGTQPNADPNKVNAIGGLVLARYWRQFPQTLPTYFEVGMGVQLNDRVTTDINSYLNTTPVVGVGLIASIGGQEFLLGLRFFHISNGGTRRPNQGQNQLHFHIGAKI